MKAGQDDRNKNLHPCRFLPAPVCTAKDLWLHAREVLGPASLPPGSCFNMAAVGLTSYVTSRGWIGIHNPGPPLSPSAFLTSSTFLLCSVFNIWQFFCLCPHPFPYLAVTNQCNIQPPPSAYSCKVHCTYQYVILNLSLSVDENYSVIHTLSGIHKYSNIKHIPLCCLQYFMSCIFGLFASIVPWFLVQGKFFAWFFASLLSFVRISNVYCCTYILGLFTNIVPFSHWSSPR